MDKELLTLKECEELTKRKVATWRRDVLERKIPYIKLGRSVRIEKQVIMDLIAASRREAVKVAT